ncbi:MAG: PH domain-containing protein [Methanotrichaceae archaeon]|nr:PH domain-containing protein [Methanotrichaceae archaeon]
MPFCTNCGIDYSKGSKFCSNCGTKIGELPEVQPVEDLAEEVVLWEGHPSGLTSGITSSTRYILTNQRLKVTSGRIGKKYEEIELIRIKDVKAKEGLKERALGIGSVEIISSDETDPKLFLKDVKDPFNVMDIIRSAARKEKTGKLTYSERL